MSYLDLPRLHFSGSFQTDPSTINNYPSNYSVDYVTHEPDSQKLKWNPNGSHAWSFRDCRVTKVCYADGTRATDPKDDPIVGAAFVGEAENYPAKLTSLDTENQITYEVWAFTRVGVGLGTPAGGFLGNCRVTQGAEGWQRVPMPNLQQTNNPYTTARFLSVLDDLEWSDKISSRFLRELRAKCGDRANRGDRLAINYVCDGYSEDPYVPGNRGGRVVGTVGPATLDEPTHFVAGRLLRPTGFQTDNPFLGSPCFFAPVRVESGKRVTMDLGNSLPTTLIGGPPPNLGDLRLAIRRSRVQVGRVLKSDDDLGGVHYRPTQGVVDSSVYLESAFVQDFPWKAGVDDTPLALVRLGDEGQVTQIYLEEDPLGRYLIAEVPAQRLGESGEYMGEGIAIRMNPDDRARVDVRAYEFGRPAPGVEVDLFQSTTFLDRIAGDKGQAGTPDTPPVGVPEDALAIISSQADDGDHGQAIRRVKTGKDGRATFSLQADNPLVDGQPPRYGGRLDGQVYTVEYRWAGSPRHSDAPPSAPQDPWNVLSVKIYNSSTLANVPTWKDIQPIFAQYAKMYPYMANIVDLASYHAVSQPRTAQLLSTVLRLPIDHPNHMPVTRDLSRSNREMILDWIENGMPL